MSKREMPSWVKWTVISIQIASVCAICYMFASCVSSCSDTIGLTEVLNHPKVSGGR